MNWIWQKHLTSQWTKLSFLEEFYFFTFFSAIWLKKADQSAGVVEYTDCISVEG